MVSFAGAFNIGTMFKFGLGRKIYLVPNGWTAADLKGNLGSPDTAMEVSFHKITPGVPFML